MTSRAWLFAAAAGVAGLLIWRTAGSTRWWSRAADPSAAIPPAPTAQDEGAATLEGPELVPVRTAPDISPASDSPEEVAPSDAAHEVNLNDLEGDAWVVAHRQRSITDRLEEFRAKPTIHNARTLLQNAVYAHMDLMGTCEVYPSAGGVTVSTDHPVDRDHLKATSLLGNDELRVYAYSRQEFPLFFEVRDREFYPPDRDPQHHDPEPLLEPELVQEVIAEAEYVIRLLEHD